MRTLTRVGMLVIAVTLCGPAVASADFLDDYAPRVAIDPGLSRGSGGYHNQVTLLSGQSFCCAYSGVWTESTSGSRSSAATYCETPQCRAAASYSGPWPTGRCVVHHHGNAGRVDFHGYCRYLS